MPSHHKYAVKDFQDRVSVRHRFPNPRKCMTYLQTMDELCSSRSGSGFLNYMPVSRESQLNPRA
ncbi:unnamed protein product [Callosobruchus maculatus]|uniref:Uncharacterized protein n=1 Tax=Callosobruchus maculatus TaxID=64391 RepID=A0A653BFB1_CALMS|nr:unnamed protein product [Callosobruchus maculatus]